MTDKQDYVAQSDQELYTILNIKGTWKPPESKSISQKKKTKVQYFSLT